MKNNTVFSSFPLSIVLLLTALLPIRAAVIEAWLQRYNGPANSYDNAQAVAVDASGNVAVTGYSYNGTNVDIYTVKYAAATGALLWEQRYNGLSNGNDFAFAVAVAADANGNVAVTGLSFNDLQTGSGDFYTAKYAATDGALLWEKRYNGPANNLDGPTALALDPVGNVVVTGYSANSNGVGIYTAKYAATNGALLWEKRNDRNGGDFSYRSALAVDASGNVIVTGSFDRDNEPEQDTSSRFYTVKYASTNGTVLWEQEYTEGPGANYAHAVAVDTNGNVLVTGSSANNNNYGDYFTLKYAAANGVCLWENRYHNPTNRAASPWSLAVDRSGNVVVTGSSYNYTNNHGDYYTAKYAAADGALLWEQSYNGPEDHDDTAHAVRVDDSGNAVVTGYSQGTGTNYYNLDYYTVKYAAADGALLWEQRYKAFADENDEQLPHGLALGPNGMVVITGTSQGTTYDYATVVYWETLPLISIATVPAGIRLHLTVPSERSYVIEGAPTVAGPWISNATVTAFIGGLVEYIDTNAPPGSAFYRVTSQ